MTFDLTFVVFAWHFKQRLLKSVESSFHDLLEPRPTHYLLNYAHEGKKATGQELKKRYTVIGDSGGLQDAKRGLEVDPTSVSRWYNDNVHRGLALDKIPTSTGATEQALFKVNKAIVKACAEQTRTNVEAMAKVQNGYDLYYIYQGDSWDTLTDWHANSTPTLAQGIAVKQTDKYRSNAEILTFLWEHFKDRPLHFLGVGGPSRYLPLILLAKYWKGPITADSQRYMWGTMSRWYCNPAGPGAFVMNNDAAGVYGGVIPCDCRYCRLIEEKGQGAWAKREAEEEDSLFVNRMLMAHNIFVERRREAFFKNLVQNEEHFFIEAPKWCSSRSDGGVAGEDFDSSTLLHLIRDLKEIGVDEVKRKYNIGGAKAEVFF